MNQPLRVYLEIGAKKIFAGALDWPGWCRSAKDETGALQALLDYAPRYRRALEPAGLHPPLPLSPGDLTVVERLPGSSATDFGAPGAIPQADWQAAPGLSATELQRLRQVLQAGWAALDAAAAQAQGKTLRLGPRGGGRDLAKLAEHVSEAELGYLNMLGWYQKLPAGAAGDEKTHLVRQAVSAALDAAALDRLPRQRARGGTPWPLPYFVRRCAWHTFDHAWEIEDRT